MTNTAVVSRHVGNFQTHLEDLNDAQREAVMHGDGPLLIFAGAGSGKTRVLTRRIAHLILEHGASPSQILAVTFTNKAAREMKHRVENLFPQRSLPVWVATFHSTCTRILRQHAPLIDYGKNFAIYDSSDSMSALKRAFKRLSIDTKVLDPYQVARIIDRAKNDYQFSDSIRQNIYLGREVAEMAAQLFDAYQEELKTSNAMDFGDLMANTVTLFKLEPNLLASYQQRFKYLMIDEYQDTNRVQYLLIRQLTEKNHNICVVGDDDQSIYGFRGANVETILNFQHDFPEAKIVTLDINYRSTQNILTAANAIIRVNERRQPKTMRTPNPPGHPLTCFKAFDEKDEAEFVARELAVLFMAEFQPSDVAIFYRTNAQSRAIEEALLESGLPYQIFGGHRFYDRKEIKDLLAYYRLVLNPKDNEAFLRIINTPTRGIGSTVIAALSVFAQKSSLSLLEAANLALAGESPLSTAQINKLRVFVDIVQKLAVHAHTAEVILTNEKGAYAPVEVSNAIAHFIHTIAVDSGYLKHLEAQDTPEAEGRVENINELCRVAVDFVERCLDQGATPSLNDFLDRASLSSDLEQENSPIFGEGSETKLQGHISLMTLHLAKGLEFDAVFMVGLEEGLLPHNRSIDDREALEEERRLCYVGITRARKLLYLSRATDRQTYGRGNWYSGVPSRFMDDLPPEIIDDRRSGFLSEF
ncbi:MAG: UvrD-helicase domain-containing protein [Bdellovibrionota bacterium]